MRMARSSANALAVVLMDRVPSDAARASAPTWSTPGRPWRNRRSDASEPAASDSWSGRRLITAPAVMDPSIGPDPDMTGRAQPRGPRHNRPHGWSTGHVERRGTRRAVQADLGDVRRLVRDRGG